MENDAKNILDMDLDEDSAALLRESLENWKEEVMSSLMEEVEEIKESKIEELESQAEEYKTQLKEEYADKMLDALKEMKEEMRAEILSEVYDENPELQILEKIKELVAPTLNEEFLGNVFSEELQTLREKVEELEREKELDEGAKKLAELVAPYSEKTQNIILSLIKEGGPEEVTEQFYELVESLEAQVEDEEEEDDEDDGEEDYEGDDEEEDDEEDDDEEEEEDEEVEEDEEEEDYDNFIEEEEKGTEEEAKKTKLTMKEQMRRAVGLM